MPRPLDRQPPTRLLGAPAWRPGQRPGLGALERLAEEQFDLLTHAQCRAAGLTWKVIRSRLHTGRWVRLHPEVYLTKPGRADPMTTLTAALLAVGEPAALSHGSAAYLHGLTRDTPEVHVSIPAERTMRLDGLTIHRTRHFEKRVDELAWPWRTTVEDTILDRADVTGVSVESAIGLVARACSSHLTTPAAIARALGGRPRHRLRGDLRDVLTDVSGGAESVLEVRFLRGVVRPHRLPEGVGQHDTRSGRHDRAFPEQRLLLELDGRVGHAGWYERQRDSRRDRRAGGDGWFTARAYWSDVVGTPCVFAAELTGLLRQRGWDGAARPCPRPGCVVR